MGQYLPYTGFKWSNKKEIDTFDINTIEYDSIEENSQIVYTLEVDLKYSDKLHELHNDYPLAPEKLEIS